MYKKKRVGRHSPYSKTSLIYSSYSSSSCVLSLHELHLLPIYLFKGYLSHAFLCIIEFRIFKTRMKSRPCLPTQPCPKYRRAQHFLLQKLIPASPLFPLRKVCLCFNTCLCHKVTIPSNSKINIGILLKISSPTCLLPWRTSGRLQININNYYCYVILEIQPRRVFKLTFNFINIFWETEMKEPVHLRFHHTKADVLWSAHDEVSSTTPGLSTSLRGISSQFCFTEPPSRLNELLFHDPPQVTVCTKREGRPIVLAKSTLETPNLNKVIR